MDENQGFFVGTPLADAQVPTQSRPEVEIAYRIRQAKKAGYSDDDIVSVLAEENKNVQKAVKSGFKPSDIVEEYLTSSMGVGEVAGRAIRNIPSSFAGVVSGLAEAVTSPIETAKTVLDLGAGILQNVLPESVVQTIGEDKASREVANKVGQFYADRYGSVEGAKRAIASDPVGVLADVSTLLTGGAGTARLGAGGAVLAGRAGAPVSAGAITGPLAVAEQLSRTAAAVDPLAIAGRTIAATTRGAGGVVAPIIGMQTGAGREAISQAFGAGRRGGETAEQFRANITGRADPTEVLDIARANLEEMNRLKQAEYRSGMVDIKRDKTVLDLADIDKSLGNARLKTQYQGKVVNVRAAQELDDVSKILDEWRNADPNTFLTPEGLDALKKRVGDVLEGIPFEQKTARAAVGEVYNSIKSSIQTQAPTYAKTMKAYSDASEQIREISRTLSIGNKASTDTAMRKLQSLMRDNVQTNYGQRVKLAKELQKVGGEFMPGLAGQSLSSLTPRGLQQITGGGLGALFALTGNIPQALAVGAMSSPRTMGEISYAAGRTARGLDVAAQQAPFAVNPQLYNLLYQSGQLQGLLGE
jgi:transcription antitermination factor NusG